MKRFLIFWTLVVTALVLPNAFGHENPGIQGVVVDAEYRFHPVVQRLMAERTLRAMPLQNGKLYYVYPAMSGNTAYLEALQLQNLERLLDKTADQTTEEKEAD